MNLATYSIEKKAVSLVAICLIVFAGIISYTKLGRLEDPDFTIKKAVIFTSYPGATAREVELEITEPLEAAVQQLKQLDKVTSISRSGLSIIYAEVQDKYDKHTLPQVWDELRRKINDVSSDLPPGCGEPLVNDDFGDVYGIFFAITGDGYSNHDLNEVADDLRKELLLCDQVGRIDFWGLQTEVIYIEIDRNKLAQLGLSPTVIFNTISKQNTVTDAGEVKAGQDNIKFRVAGDYEKIQDLGEELISGGSEGRMIRLKDVATIERGYYDPPTALLRRNGVPAIGLGISTVKGGNVVVMGDSVREKLAEISGQIPVGIKLHRIAYQADTVENAVNGFVLNLVEAVFIVILLLFIFMGKREGVIIGIILLITILATFIMMYLIGVNLQRISLGALIIALGMLVDNAIVVAEGIVIKSHYGLKRKAAGEETVRETQWPLFGATLIAILAFAAISVSKDVTGEFLGSLFQVIGVSLGLSWLFALTLTPYLCTVFLPEKIVDENDDAPHSHVFYEYYKKFLEVCIKHRRICLCTVAFTLFLSMYGFRFVKKNFFPDSTRQQFTIDLWYPEGTHIKTTAAKIEAVEQYVKKVEGVTDVTSFIGRGALRFILTYSPEMPNSAYGQLLVSVDDYEKLHKIINQVRAYLGEQHPGLINRVEAFKLGPGGSAIEARISGPSTDVLRHIADKVKDVMRHNDNTRTIKSDWGDKVKTSVVMMSQANARDVGISRPEIGNSIKMNFSGVVTGLYREGENLLPIILRPPLAERENINDLENVQVWSSGVNKAIPIKQVVSDIETKWENPVIQRRNRKRTISISCQQIEGTANSLFSKLRKPIEDIKLPPGYSLEWGGEYESSNRANKKLMANFPATLGLMFIISVMLFNTLRHPVIIFLGLPLALIGVTIGLLVSGQAFGFMAILGFLSLSGMLIKNEIVLLDQINIELANGVDPYNAVIYSAISRVRPVTMAAFTTVLGMIPLLWDAFFAAMAVTIMAGLTFATILTLVVVPVLYCTLFKIKAK